jgi:hypothetical protein
MEDDTEFAEWCLWWQRMAREQGAEELSIPECAILFHERNRPTKRRARRNPRTQRKVK